MCEDGGVRTHASEETGALNQRLRPLGHVLACMYEWPRVALRKFPNMENFLVEILHKWEHHQMGVTEAHRCKKPHKHNAVNSAKYQGQFKATMANVNKLTLTQFHRENNSYTVLHSYQDAKMIFLSR